MDSSPRTQKSTSLPVWDLSTQTPHGGQEWRHLDNFMEDFSVTTNPLGTPVAALEAACDSLTEVLHYPSADGEPARTQLAKFLLGARSGNPEAQKDLTGRLLLGNGASELIDLCIRLTPGRSWRPGPFLVQYKEYERAATNAGKSLCASNDTSAEMVCLVNPCNPTGDYFSVEKVKRFIEENCTAGTADSPVTVIVDESMQPWLGPEWRDDSLTSQTKWIHSQATERHVRIFVIHSWTKLWSCPGLRVGSLLAPTAACAQHLKTHQVPWSVNTAALRFLEVVVSDEKYLEDTWRITRPWREELCAALKELRPEWELLGAPFLSYVWVRTTSQKEAQYCTDKCRLLGVPIRWGLHGYNQPEYIRLAVRDPKYSGFTMLWFLVPTAATSVGSPKTLKVKAALPPKGRYIGVIRKFYSRP